MGDGSLISRATHVSIALSVVLGLGFGVAAFAASEWVLVILGTKAELMAGAILYLRIICVGIPFQTVYTFGAAIQRSAGHSRISLYVLGLTGLLNVLLNLFFVIVCNMSVDGVAWATVISQFCSAVMIIISLMRRNDACKLHIRKLKIEIPMLKEVLRFGLPSGIQSSIFAFANMILTSAINTLSTATVYAFTVVSNVDALAATVMNSFTQAASTFFGQNYGARDYKRVKRSLGCAIGWSLFSAILCGQVALLFGKEISVLFVTGTNPLFNEIIEISVSMLKVTLNFLFFCGIMNVLAGFLRSVGFPIVSMISNIVGVVGGRLVWIFVFFPMERFHSGQGLIICYPAAWIFDTVLLGICSIYAYAKLKKKFTDASCKAEV